MSKFTVYEIKEWLKFIAVCWFLLGGVHMFWIVLSYFLNIPRGY